MMDFGTLRGIIAACLAGTEWLSLIQLEYRSSFGHFGKCTAWLKNR